MTDPFQIYLSPDAKTWSPGPTGGAYAPTYKLAAKLSRDGSYARIKNVEMDVWLVCFKDGEIVQVE